MTIIKSAEYKDLQIVHELANKIWPSAYGDILASDQLDYMLWQIYSLSSLQNQFENLHHNFIIAFDERVPIGFASFSPKENNNIYKLHKIYVLPQQQGTGIGKLLLNHIIGLIKKSHASTLELNVNRYNKARLFYEKLGFKIIAEEDIDIGNGYFMNDYIMQLDVR